MAEEKIKHKTEEETQKMKEREEKSSENRNEKIKEKLVEEKITEEKAKVEVKEEKVEVKKPATKKQEKVKKDKAVVNAKNIKVSLKQAVAICRVIRKKSIPEAISFLEKVIIKEKAVPMKGELPHRKGERIMSGRYPENASIRIIKILKSLISNCIANGLDLDNVIISEAIPNTAGKATNTKKGKKIHLTLIAKEKSTEKSGEDKQRERRENKK